MMIKDLGPAVVSVWEGLRPMTKKMLVGVLESSSAHSTGSSKQTFFYDAHTDLELRRLLSALDEQSKKPGGTVDRERLDEVNRLAEICVRVLEAQSLSAEGFIQLAERAIKKHDYKHLDKLADRLFERFAPVEIAEIVRQTELAQIRALAYETLAVLPVPAIAPLLDDPLYSEIAANALEQKAYEFESDEARDLLEQYDFGRDGRDEL
ncbi:MAG: hypothetical protein LC730_04640 [Acidobacteria bacterium]|nr:hypothetical protein [Acidobacteriota bacterium]MCA1608732.1 hypothetical protein [Acidobacteriota bacterium]